MRTRILSTFLLALLLALPLALFLPLNGTAHAAGDVYWVGVGSGNWNDATRWSTGAVPTSSDNVYITLNGTYAVVVSDSRSANSVTLGAAGNTGTQIMQLEVGSSTSAVLTVSNGFTNTKTLASSRC